MKEKKNEKKKEYEIEEMPSKGKIIFAWFLLVILLFCTGGLVYLKNFKQPDEQFESALSNKVSPVVLNALSDIVNKFNTSSLIEDYKQEGLTLSAVLKDTTIIITYSSIESNGSIDYVYNVAGNLTAIVSNTDEEIKDKVFKAMVIACRERVNLTDDVSNDIDSFISDETELYGLKKEIVNDNINYYVDIRYPASEPESNMSTGSTDTSVNDSNEQINDNDGIIDNSDTMLDDTDSSIDAGDDTVSNQQQDTVSENDTIVSE